ncbi:hypothetical protein M3Y99_00808700 [Aphelenchoides fujianensis]|nr:hypothetical protein M3Y99_00808700 [Aphelenchoides fujianensis]
MSWAKRWSEADDWGISGKPSMASKKSKHKRVGKAREASENMLVMAEENADLKSQIEDLKWKHEKQQKAAYKAAVKEVEQLKVALSDEQTRSSSLQHQTHELKKAADEAIEIASGLESKLAAVQQEMNQIKNAVVEQQAHAEGIKQVLEERLQKMLDEAVAEEKRKWEAVEKECESLKLEKEEAAAKISELTAALEQQRQARESNEALKFQNGVLVSQVAQLEAKCAELQKRREMDNASCKGGFASVLANIQKMRANMDEEDARPTHEPPPIQRKPQPVKEKSGTDALAEAECTKVLGVEDQKVEGKKTALAPHLSLHSLWNLSRDEALKDSKKGQKNNENKPEGVCSLPHCNTLFAVTEHAAYCTNGPSCGYPHCASVQQLLNEWWAGMCKESCIMCKPRDLSGKSNGKKASANVQAATPPPQPFSGKPGNLRMNKKASAKTDAFDPTGLSNAFVIWNGKLQTAVEFASRNEVPPPLSPTEAKTEPSGPMIPFKSLGFSVEKPHSAAEFAPPNAPPPPPKEQPAPLPPTEAKEWHALVPAGLRSEWIVKVVQATCPSLTRAAMAAERVRPLVEFAQDIEEDFFSLAVSKAEYAHWMAVKIRTIEQEREVRKRQQLKEQRKGGSQQSTASTSRSSESSPSAAKSDRKDGAKAAAAPKAGDDANGATVAAVALNVKPKSLLAKDEEKDGKTPVHTPKAKGERGLRGQGTGDPSAAKSEPKDGAKAAAAPKAGDDANGATVAAVALNVKPKSLGVKQDEEKSGKPPVETPKAVDKNVETAHSPTRSVEERPRTVPSPREYLDEKRRKQGKS